MGESKRPDDAELVNLLAKAAEGLPDSARKILLAHPQALRSALAAAACALTTNTASIETIGSSDSTGLIDSEDARHRSRPARYPPANSIF